ncbi:MAG: LicD family protein [Candidatus Marinimicrobia bacterium]|nr:LicD family protein [Candidatus Neomarinimicrobiota bacterium]
MYRGANIQSSIGKIAGYGEKKAMKLLLYTKKVFDNNGIPFWLDSGTLLGLYRDGRLIPNKKNLTIGIPAQYLQNILSLKASFLPWYRLRLKYDKSGYSWIDGNITKLYFVPIIAIKHRTLGLNINLTFNKGKYTRWVSGMACKQVLSEHYSNLDSLTIVGKTFQTPGNIEKYLTVRYGNWRQVVDRWDTNSDDGSIIDKKTMLSLPRKTRCTNPKRFRKRVYLTGKNLIKMKKLLSDTVSILEKNGIKYWLDFGTLLGVIRDKELIAWDHDVDICISGKDVEKFLAIKKKFPIRYRISMRYDHTGRLPGTLRLIKIKYWHRKYLMLFKFQEIYLDIFIKYRVGDYYYWISTHTPKRVKAEYHEDLDTIYWDNRNYAIPSNVDQYLTDTFGDWRTPVKNFDSSLDDFTIYEELQYKPKRRDNKHV